ncbi:MAG: PDZ domain-containing protein [Chitinivibrionales bacterium]|nr:PDZ domain-containing protein [Chitinivibrionales bacterium]
MQKKFFRHLVQFVFPALPLIAASGAERTVPASGDSSDISHAIDKIAPALVRIHVVSIEHMQGKETKFETSGSGVIITEQGHVVTNHHVAGRARRITCTMASRDEIKAELVGTDPLTDIAVIKLIPEKKRTFQTAPFGESSKVKVGDRVMAMGSPLALSQSVTMGIISNTELVMPEMYWPFNKITIDGEDVGLLVRWIGHDADIFPGNSGGPLVNLAGEIVGINEISLGIGAAIPADLARRIAREIIENGEIVRSWTGLEVQPLLENSRVENGVLVSGTIVNSPAHKAGIQSGDIITKIGEYTPIVHFAEELPVFNNYIVQLPVGKSIAVSLIRNDTKKKCSLTSIQRDYLRPETVEIKQWGMTVRNISLMAAKEMKRDSQDGVLVTSLRPGGPCDEARPSIISNDIIVKVNGTPVRNIHELAAATSTITDTAGNGVPVLVAFERKEEQRLTIVKIGTREMYDYGYEVRKAWLPISVQVLTSDIAAHLGIPGKSGVRITRIYPDSRTENSGLKVGDVITMLDNERLDVSEPEDVEFFNARIRDYKTGSVVSLGILRDKKEITKKVTLVKSPQPSREMKKFRDNNFEFTARNISYFDRVNNDFDQSLKGVIVEIVDQGGWAALGNLAVGDIILSINKKPVAAIAELETTMKSIEKMKEPYAVFQVRRGIHTLFLEIEPDWNKK